MDVYTEEEKAKDISDIYMEKLHKDAVDFKVEFVGMGKGHNGFEVGRCNCAVYMSILIDKSGNELISKLFPVFRDSRQVNVKEQFIESLVFKSSIIEVRYS